MERIYALRLTDRQQQAVDMATALSNTRNEKPVVGVLKGYAGTGKTTTLREIAATLGGIEPILAPTGKAALRVSEATGLEAMTIHRWMFGVIENPETGEITFARKDIADIRRPESGVLVIDEASMLDRELWAEILNLCEEIECNILCVGDAFQLPPVAKGGGEGFSVLSDGFPAFRTVMLDEVMRQAMDSPIIRASMAIRMGDMRALRSLPSIRFNELYHHIDELNKSMDGVALCYKNSTRHTLNNQVRELRGYTYEIQVGEPLLVMKNCYKIERFNGEVLTFRGWKAKLSKMLTVKDRYTKAEMQTRYGVANLDGDTALIAVADIFGNMENISQKAKQLWGRIAMRESDYDGADRLPLVTANFGYALTCHKAQGSEWDKVLVYVERSIDQNKEEDRRWLYTAITRAKEEVALFWE